MGEVGFLDEVARHAKHANLMYDRDQRGGDRVHADLRRRERARDDHRETKLMNPAALVERNEKARARRTAMLPNGRQTLLAPRRRTGVAGALIAGPPQGCANAAVGAVHDSWRRKASASRRSGACVIASVTSGDTNGQRSMDSRVPGKLATVICNHYPERSRFRYHLIVEKRAGTAALTSQRTLTHTRRRSKAWPEPRI